MRESIKGTRKRRRRRDWVWQEPKLPPVTDCHYCHAIGCGDDGDTVYDCEQGKDLYDGACRHCHHRRVTTFERVLELEGQTGSEVVEFVRFEHVRRDATHRIIHGARLVYKDGEPWKLIYREGVPIDGPSFPPGVFTLTNE